MAKIATTTAPKAAGAEALGDLAARYMRSSRSSPFSGDLIVHGPPGHGKSWFMASGSKSWPTEEFFAKPVTERSWVTLSDIIILAWDDGATDGLKAHRIDVPMIPVREMAAELGAQQAAFTSLVLLEQHLEASKAAGSPVRLIAHDTISEQDKEIEGELRTKPWDDPRQMYGALFQFHSKYRRTAKDIALRLGARNLFSCHSVPKTEQAGSSQAAMAASKLQKLQRKAGALPGAPEIYADITGKGHGVYINNSSLVLTIRTIVAKGQPSKRIVSLGGTDGFEEKNRFQGILNDEEPADLGLVLAKLDASASA